MIVVENLVKSYHSTRVLHGVDHAQKRGEAVVLIGPSGCGKSTFLRCLNQLEIADAGRISIGGVILLGGQPRRTAPEKEQPLEPELHGGPVLHALNPFSPPTDVCRVTAPQHRGDSTA